jgi:hypothetical protein
VGGGSGGRGGSGGGVGGGTGGSGGGGDEGMQRHLMLVEQTPLYAWAWSVLALLKKSSAYPKAQKGGSMEYPLALAVVSDSPRAVAAVSHIVLSMISEAQRPLSSRMNTYDAAPSRTFARA